jgi:hypothetical protein
MQFRPDYHLDNVRHRGRSRFAAVGECLSPPALFDYLSFYLSDTDDVWLLPILIPSLSDGVVLECAEGAPFWFSASTKSQSIAHSRLVQASLAGSLCGGVENPMIAQFPRGARHMIQASHRTAGDMDGAEDEDAVPGWLAGRARYPHRRTCW